jgi:Uma2 family endonuclease
MTHAWSRPRKTVADFMALPEGTRAELASGEASRSPSPKSRHRLRIVKSLSGQNGVPECWIVDPVARSVEVLGSERGHVAPYGCFEAGDVLTSNVLAGLALPVDEIMAG